MPRLIDKDELKKAIQKNICEVMCDEPRGCSYCRVDDVWEVIYEMPTVEAELVRHGHWIFNPKDAIEMMFTLPKCSGCGAESPNGGNYCPNCGAKMDEVEDG